MKYKLFTAIALFLAIMFFIAAKPASDDYWVFTANKATVYYPNGSISPYYGNIKIELSLNDALVGTMRINTHARYAVFVKKSNSHKIEMDAYDMDTSILGKLKVIFHYKNGMCMKIELYMLDSKVVYTYE